VAQTGDDAVNFRQKGFAKESNPHRGNSNGTVKKIELKKIELKTGLKTNQQPIGC
jgi:hypothetical protein